MLIAAKFSNGEIIEQLPGEDPANTYGSILTKQRNGAVLDVFGFVLDELTWMVDLKDGKFGINDEFFYINKQDWVNPLRLIYYRTRGITLSEDGSSGLIPEIYNLGFQTNLPCGQNIKQIL